MRLKGGVVIRHVGPPNPDDVTRSNVTRRLTFLTGRDRRQQPGRARPI